MKRLPVFFGLAGLYLLANTNAWSCPECGGKKTLGPATAAMIDSMQAADKSIATLPLDGDADHDFARMMVVHHAAALEMAKAELLHGKDPVLRRMAQGILVEQNSEIEAINLRIESFSGDAEAPARSNFPKTDNKPAAAELFPANAAIPDGTASSSHDRVYSADQTSNTVSVIDPSTDALLGVIRLGDPVPGALSPLYRSQLLVHGLGYSPDHRILAVVSVGSNSVTFIDTATNTVKGVVYIGRSPHEAFFTPDGHELWCTVRGENYVSVIDPVAFRETRRIVVGNGPGMVMFRPDGKYAFVCSSFTPTLYVVDPATYEVVAKLDQASPFSPNIAVTPDGAEIWITLKDVGKTQIWKAEPPFEPIATLDTGPITNHVNFAGGPSGPLAYITVGGLNAVKVYKREQGKIPALITAIPVGALPHGVWPSGDGRRVYVGLENGGAVQAIDTTTNQVVSSIRSGQTCQALVYVPGAVPEGSGTENLKPLGEAGVVQQLTLGSAQAGSDASATVAVNSLGLTDLLQIAAKGLTPGSTYKLCLTSSRGAPPSSYQPLAAFTANPSGAAIAQTLGPLRRVLGGEAGTEMAKQGDRRWLAVIEAATGAVVLMQRDE